MCAGCLLTGLEAADQGLVGDVGVVDLEGPHVDEVGTAAFNIDGPRGVVLAVLVDAQVVAVLTETPVNSLTELERTDAGPFSSPHTSCF